MYGPDCLYKRGLLIEEMFFVGSEPNEMSARPDLFFVQAFSL